MRPRRDRVLAALAMLVPLLSTGCGNQITAEVIGMAAVTRGGDGGPVVLVKVCRKDIDRITVYSSREGLSQDEPNPRVGSWTSHRARTGTIRLRVDRPSPGWLPDPATPDPVVFAPDRGYVVTAQRSTEDAEVTQASFRGRALGSLDPGHLLVMDSRTWTVARFRRHACDRPDQD